MPHDDDAELMRRVVAQDRQAFETLYQRYYARLFGYVVKFLKHRELVEEVVNDVMFIVWTNAARFNRTSRLSSWIFGIAHNRVLKALGNVTPAPPELTPETLGLHAADNPERTMQQQDLRRTLTQALAALSPEHRAVIELTFYHGLSYQEIAEIVDCPVNTVKTRMFHARRRLETLLPGFGLEYPP
jgi:RNA polymerase sigma-70 factor (ECF subfamily)